MRCIGCSRSRSSARSAGLLHGEPAFSRAPAPVHWHKWGDHDLALSPRACCALAYPPPIAATARRDARLQRHAQSTQHALLYALFFACRCPAAYSSAAGFPVVCRLLPLPLGAGRKEHPDLRVKPCTPVRFALRDSSVDVAGR